MNKFGIEQIWKCHKMLRVFVFEAKHSVSLLNQLSSKLAVHALPNLVGEKASNVKASPAFCLAVP